MRPNLPFMYMFIFLVFFGTFFSLSSLHWLGAWGGLELNLVGFLPILIYQKGVLETEGAVKYFIIQALGSSLLMASSLLSFNLSLTWEMISSFDYISSFSIVNFSFMWGILLLSSFLLKIGAFPFHFWLPSVMVSASWLPCTILATWQKIAPMFLFFSVLEIGLNSFFFEIFCLQAVGGSLIGGLGGLNQTQIRSLLAYSSIGHMGWMVFSSCCSLELLSFYLGIYILITGCTLLAFWHLNFGNMKEMMLFNKSILDFLGSFIFLLSLGGMPPLLGFLPKLLVINCCASLWNSYVGIMLFIGSLISLYYYLTLFFGLYLSFLGSSLLNIFSMMGFSWSNLLSLSVSVNFLGMLGIVFIIW